MDIPVVVQYRHVHLSKNDRETLFGEGLLEVETKLGHRGQVVYKEAVSVSGPKGAIENVRILGPGRNETQVEVSASEANILGINAPVRHSGDLSRTGGCTIFVNDVQIKVSSSVIVPAMHLHVSEIDAKEMNINNHDSVCLQLTERPEVVFEEVLVRVHPTYSTEFHLSSDEAAELWIQSNEKVTLC
jgi:putative phosphotransacetylase